MVFSIERPPLAVLVVESKAKNELLCIVKSTNYIGYPLHWVFLFGYDKNFEEATVLN